MNKNAYKNSVGSTNQRFWISMMFFLLFVLALSVGGGIYYGDEKFYLIAFAIVVLIIPTLYQYISRDAELFSPMNLIFLNLFFGMFLQTAVLCFFGDVNTNLFLDPQVDFNVLMVGMAAMVVAVLFLVIGYSYNPWKTKLRRKSDSDHISVVEMIASWPRNRVVLLGLFFGLITFLSFIYFALTVGLFEDLSRYSVKRNNLQGGNTGIARFGMRFAQVGCIIVFTYHLACSRVGVKSGVFVLAILLFVLASAGPFVSSSRSLLLYFFVALFIVHHFVSGGWRARQMSIALFLVVAVVVSMGVLRYVQQRSVTFTDYNQEIGIGNAIGKIAASNNFLGIKKTAVLLDIVPSQEPHSYGSTYLLWIVAPIPRALWPDKPTVRIGGVLGSKIYGTRETNGIPPGFVGEAYYNFGWFGIPLIAVLFGVCIRRFYESVGKKSYTNPKSLLIYAMLFTPVAFASLSSDFTGFISRMVQILIPLLLAIKIVGINSNSGHRSSD